MNWLNLGKGRRSKIARFLDKNGVTQQELAEKSGVSKSTISRICQGDAFAPTMKNAQKIVRALKKITKKDDIHYDEFWM